MWRKVKARDFRDSEHDERRSRGRSVGISVPSILYLIPATTGARRPPSKRPRAMVPSDDKDPETTGSNVGGRRR
jgi:hypothetical protein